MSSPSSFCRLNTGAVDLDGVAFTTVQRVDTGGIHLMVTYKSGAVQTLVYGAASWEAVQAEHTKLLDALDSMRTRKMKETEAMKALAVRCEVMTQLSPGTLGKMNPNQLIEALFEGMPECSEVFKNSLKSVLESKE